MAEEGIEEVASAGAVIRFEARLCIHSRNCVLGRPDVFVPNVEGAWIHPERATPDEIAELAHNCPSGAIQYRRLDGGPAEAPPRVNTVRLRENGPLAFNAPLTDRRRPGRACARRCAAAAPRSASPGATAATTPPASPPPASRRPRPQNRSRPATAPSPSRPRRTARCRSRVRSRWSRAPAARPTG